MVWKLKLGTLLILAVWPLFLNHQGAAPSIAAIDTSSNGGSSEARPNIVLIISDDQRWSDYGFMDHPFIETPNLDRLARQSALFRHGYVPTALCRASLMTLITGRYAFEHHTCGNDPLASKSDGPSVRERKQKVIDNLDRFESIPKVLGRLGYLSHQSGKWWEGHFSHGGFTHGMTLGLGNTPRGRHGDLGLTIGRKGMRPIEDFLDETIAKKKNLLLVVCTFSAPHAAQPAAEVVGSLCRNGTADADKKNTRQCVPGLMNLAAI